MKNCELCDRVATKSTTDDGEYYYFICGECG